MNEEWIEIPPCELTLQKVDQAQVYEVSEIASYLKPRNEGWGFHFGGDARIVVIYRLGSPVSFDANEVRFFRNGNDIFVARA